MANLMGSNESIGSIQFGDLDLDFDLELDLDLNKEIDNKSVNVEVVTFGDALNDSANKTTGVDSTKDYIVNMVRGLNPEDDEVNMDEKIKYIKKQFCSLVQNKEQLFEMMAYINNKALIDKIIALKFGFLFSSELFDSLIVDGTNIRNVMLQILEKNYINSDIYRIYDRNRLYNSITLLGQYYHHVRLVYNTPIAILGISLLRLMTREVNGLDYINFELAKVIRAQLQLNGDILQIEHKSELTQLIYHLKRHIIEQHSLEPDTKTSLFMSVDLYYTRLERELDKLYKKYGVDKCESYDDLNSFAKYQQLSDIEESDNIVSTDQRIQQNINSHDHKESTRYESIECKTDKGKIKWCDEVIDTESNDSQPEIEETTVSANTKRSYPRQLRDIEHKNVKSYRHERFSNGNERDQFYMRSRTNSSNAAQRTGFHPDQQTRFNSRFHTNQNSACRYGNNSRFKGVNDHPYDSYASTANAQINQYDIREYNKNHYRYRHRQNYVQPSSFRKLELQRIYNKFNNDAHTYNNNSESFNNRRPYRGKSVSPTRNQYRRNRNAYNNGK